MSKSVNWYLNSAISLAIMIFFRYIPAPEPITPVGMTVVGLFIGAIYGWCTTNMIWPSLVALIMFGFTGTVAVSATWGSLMSNMTVAICFWLMLSVGLLKNTGLIQYIADWSITRSFTRGKPWRLMILVYVCAIVCASCMAEVAVTFAFWALVWAICDEVGYEKGGKTAGWMTFTVALFVGFGGYMLPFKMAVFSGFGFLAAGSNGLYDGAFSYGAWTAFTFCIVAVMVTIYLLISKFILRIDLSKLAMYVPDESKAPVMDKKQKISLTLFVVLFFMLMLPSFMPKAWAITVFLNKFGTVGSAMLILAITCWIRVDGEPLLTFEKIASVNVNWNIIFMFGTALVLCNFINSPDSGVSAWLKMMLGPVFTNMGAFGFILCYFLLAIAITNLINNAVVAAIMIPISFSLSTAIGLNPLAVCACIILFADFGVLLPSGSPTGAMLHNSSGWIPQNILYKYCFLAIGLYILVSLVVGWPLSNILFPFAI